MAQSNSQTPRSYSKSFSTPGLGWIIWFLASLFYFYENIIQVSPGVMVPDIMAALSINSTALGGLIAFFFYSYASMQIPVGIMVDHYNARVLLTVAALACVVGSVMFGMAHHFVMAAVGRLLMGFGAAFAAVCAMKLTANWFPENRFAFLIGLLVTMGMLGSMVGQTPLAILVEHVGWRNTLMILAAAGAVLTAFMACFIRHAPTVPVNSLMNDAAKPSELSPNTSSILSGLLQVLKCRQSWILAIYGGLIFASTSILGGLWGVPFLMKAYGLSRPTAASVISFMFFGWVVGGPLSGILVNFLKSHKKILWISSVGSFLIISLLLYTPSFPLWLLYLLVFGFGLCSSFFLPSFSLVRELHAVGNTGAALGFMNMANMLGGALGQPLIGALLDMHWTGLLVNNARDYSLEAYQYALSCLPIILAASLLLLPFIKEREVK